MYNTLLAAEFHNIKLNFQEENFLIIVQMGEIFILKINYETNKNRKTNILIGFFQKEIIDLYSKLVFSQKWIF